MDSLHRHQLTAEQQSAINGYRLNIDWLSQLTEPTLVSCIWKTAEQGDLSTLLDWLPSYEAQPLVNCFFEALCNTNLEGVQDILLDFDDDEIVDAIHQLIEEADACPFSGSTRFFNEWIDSSKVVQQEVSKLLSTWFHINIIDVLYLEILPAMSQVREQFKL